MTEIQNKLLLDTSYILPLVGLKGPQLERYEKKFPKLLVRYFVLFNPLSLVEAK